MGKAGHGQLIGTPATLALVAERDSGHLAVPVHRPFTLGTLRLELIPSGRGPGGAALFVDAGSRTVLYAGAIRSVSPGQAAEVRASDAVVVAAPFGELHHRFAPVDGVAERVVAWVRSQLAVDRSPVLVVDTVGDGLEVATYLLAAGLGVSSARSLRDAAARLDALVPVPALRAPGRDPGVVIRLPSDRLKLAVGRQPSTALVSPRAIDPHPAWEVGFAWPSVAGREQLLAWIEQARAKEVFVTGPCAEPIVAALGARARMLGPPRQMALFGP